MEQRKDFRPIFLFPQPTWGNYWSPGRCGALVEKRASKCHKLASNWFQNGLGRPQEGPAARHICKAFSTVVITGRLCERLLEWRLFLRPCLVLNRASWPQNCFRDFFFHSLGSLGLATLCFAPGILYFERNSYLDFSFFESKSYSILLSI